MARKSFGKFWPFQVFRNSWQTIHWVGFLVVLLLTIAWACQIFLGGDSGSADERKAKNLIEKLAAKIAKTDPEAADRIRESARSRPGKLEGMAVALVYQQNVGKEKGIVDLASQLKDKSPLVELLDLAMDKDEFPDGKSRDEFLEAQGAVLAWGADPDLLADRTQAQLLARGHVQRIKRAQKSPDWPKLKSDALSIWILDGIKNEKLRSYYLENREWLGPVLAEFRLPNSKGELASLGSVDFEELIDISQKYHPLTREAVTGTRNSEFGVGAEGAGSIGLDMFKDHGEVIKKCADNGVPVLETVAVLYANPGWGEYKSPVEKATKLIEIQRNRKAVWGMAMQRPQILELDEKAPQYADKIIAKFGQDDIASLIVNVCQGYEESAAQAVDKYGDMAIFGLRKYYRMSQFREAMKKQNGFRAPAYMMLKGDSGLNRVGNPPDVDKEFTPQGDPAGGWGWKDVPILGGPINIVQNWANGATNEWSDLGWAALDVADGAILVATFGGSTVLTAEKQAAKAAGKKIAIELAETAAKSAIKGSRVVAKETIEKSASVGFKASLLARLGQVGEYSVIIAKKLAPISSVIYRGSKYVIGGTTKVINAAFEGAKGAYSSLTPNAKKAIRCAFLVVSLSYTMTERTLPALKKMAIDGISGVADLFYNPIEDFVTGINAGVRDLNNQAGQAIKGVINWVILLLMVVVTFQLFPGRIAYKPA